MHTYISQHCQLFLILIRYISFCTWISGAWVDGRGKQALGGGSRWDDQHKTTLPLDAPLNYHPRPGGNKVPQSPWVQWFSLPIVEFNSKKKGIRRRTRFKCANIPHNSFFFDRWRQVVPRQYNKKSQNGEGVVSMFFVPAFPQLGLQVDVFKEQINLCISFFIVFIRWSNTSHDAKLCSAWCNTPSFCRSMSLFIVG